MSDVTENAAPMRASWKKWMLVASLALNVLIFGVVLGAFVRGGAPGGRGAPQNLLGYVTSLPADRRQDLMKRSAPLRPELKALRQQARAANRDRLAAFTTEPFDRALYVEAQTRQIETETKIRMLMRDIVADTAAGMSLDERRAFLRWRPAFRAQPADDAEPEPPKKP
jgi:uncharacterized membrane protein